MGLVPEKVGKTVLSQLSVKRADCSLFSLPSNFRDTLRTPDPPPPSVASVYQLTPEEKRLLEEQHV